MTTDKLALQALANLDRLMGNPYPGRGIFVGRNNEGTYVQGSWTMGRSENSRNRVYSRERGRIFTEAADPQKVKDPRLIIYNAMREDCGRAYVVSNGDQTDAVLEGLRINYSFSSLITRHAYEPDAPNYTPRITGLINLGREPRAELAMTRQSPWGDQSDHLVYSFAELGRGIGHCLTTYEKDGNPLPAYRGEPFLLPLVGTGEQIAAALWAALNEENRVSLAVKLIRPGGESEVTIINKYEKVKQIPTHQMAH